MKLQVSRTLQEASSNPKKIDKPLAGGSDAISVALLLPLPPHPQKYLSDSPEGV